MKKVLAINGSPRRNCNTAKLLESALNGAKDAGAQTELVHLYGLNFKGCISCLYCKRKDKEHGTCAMKDDLTPVLERIKEADALIFGSPIYFMNLSAGMIAFMERLFFSNYIYSDEIPTVFPKSLPNAFIYTMNMTEDHVKDFGIRERFAFHEGTAERILKAKPKILYAYDTYQFNDYSKYESSIFDAEHKAKMREEVFPKQLDEAYELGKSLTQL
ncbi:MAG: flavodoxin family protein [Selenomonadaceae bacterium]|nr:flavodoxin family protein [Selenomonadaceae bacterium]